MRPSQGRCDDPNYEADHAKAIKGTMPDAATRLKQLDALKEQGLITESEYADKRGKILAEL